MSRAMTVQEGVFDPISTDGNDSHRLFDYVEQSDRPVHHVEWKCREWRPRSVNVLHRQSEGAAQSARPRQRERGRSFGAERRLPPAKTRSSLSRRNPPRCDETAGQR
jgi:hypothetical protein